jgi:hypothetical protein
MDILDALFNISQVLFGLFLGLVGYAIKRYFYGRTLDETGKVLYKYERRRAIIGHFISQAKGEGHSSASPVDCGEGKCTVFGSRLAVV